MFLFQYFFFIFHQAAALAALMLKTEYVKCFSIKQHFSLGVYLSTSSPSCRLAWWECGGSAILTVTNSDPLFTMPIFLLCKFSVWQFFTGFPAETLKYSSAGLFLPCQEFPCQRALGGKRTLEPELLEFSILPSGNIMEKQKDGRTIWCLPRNVMG